MGRIIDLTGQRFGRLVVVADSGIRKIGVGAVWECECDCGNHTKVSGPVLRKGTTKSCGCLRDESIKHAHDWAQENDLKEGTKLNSFSNKLSSANTSGHKGVSWNKGNKRWIAYIKIQRRTIYLGAYSNIQDAIQARKEGEEKYFKPILEKYGKE